MVALVNSQMLRRCSWEEYEGQWERCCQPDIACGGTPNL